LPTFVLIPAAGGGTRLAAGLPKQYVELAARPMLWHAIRAVCVPPVEKVFVVLAPDDERFAREDWSAFRDRLEPLYCGGRSRAESVYNGLVASRDEWSADDWMLVHDAARPCLPAKDLQALLAVNDEVGAILAVPVAETVKRASGEHIVATEERSALWLAQTPQMFRAGLLLHALSRSGGEVTDEAAAVERMGFKPRLVAGSRENIKVTWPEDLAIAEHILRARA
jgi:2-C-methyl-D-erythritol 4-phosphate cytidylyltransferase